MSTLIPTADALDAEHALFILDHTGHQTITWGAVEEAREIVKKAKAKFEEHIAKGGLAYTTDRNGNSGHATKKFDPSAERTILSPGMAGG